MEVIEHFIPGSRANKRKSIPRKIMIEADEDQPTAKMAKDGLKTEVEKFDSEVSTVSTSSTDPVHSPSSVGCESPPASRASSKPPSAPESAAVTAATTLDSGTAAAFQVQAALQAQMFQNIFKQVQNSTTPTKIATSSHPLPSAESEAQGCEDSEDKLQKKSTPTPTPTATATTVTPTQLLWAQSLRQQSHTPQQQQQQTVAPKVSVAQPLQQSQQQMQQLVQKQHQQLHQQLLQQLSQQIGLTNTPTSVNTNGAAFNNLMQVLGQQKRLEQLFLQQQQQQKQQHQQQHQQQQQQQQQQLLMMQQPAHCNMMTFSPPQPPTEEMVRAKPAVYEAYLNVVTLFSNFLIALSNYEALTREAHREAVVVPHATAAPTAAKLSAPPPAKEPLSSAGSGCSVTTPVVNGKSPGSSTPVASGTDLSVSSKSQSASSFSSASSIRHKSSRSLRVTESKEEYNTYIDPNFKVIYRNGGTMVQISPNNPDIMMPTSDYLVLMEKGTNGTKEIRLLMKHFFTRETLANSSLTGEGLYPNKLDENVISAIRDYVSKRYPKMPVGKISLCCTDVCVQTRRVMKNQERRLLCRAAAAAAMTGGGGSAAAAAAAAAAAVAANGSGHRKPGLGGVVAPGDSDEEAGGDSPRLHSPRLDSPPTHQ